MAQRPHGQEALGVAQNGSSCGQHAEMVARKAHPWIERLARFGYVAYGVVYVLGGVALGLVAYGVFMFVMARYRRIEPV